MSRWTEEVQLERARLALDDPAGEQDAVAPMTRAQALSVIERFSKPKLRSLPTDGELDQAALLYRLGGDPARGRGMLRCPAHDDRTKSLSWSISEGTLLLHCFAGCTFDEIRGAVS